MLLQTMGQLLPIVGTVGGGLVGAGIGGLASGGAGIAPGAALGSAIGGGVGQAGQVAAGAGSAAMTEPYDRAEFERQERERRRQNLLATAASIGPRR